MDVHIAEAPVSLEEIDAADDILDAEDLAEKFPETVPLEKCTFPKMKERLRLAVKKWNKQMKDLEALGTAMMKNRKEDQTNRDQLLEFYNKLQSTLTNMEAKMRKHIGTEYVNIDKTTAQFVKQLRRPANKLVVAGETSSGKSTLLNIFLEHNTEEVLPVKLLSCTATMCEIEWSEEKVAKTVTKLEQSVIDFDKRHQYICKETDRERRFPHDLVRLQMPSPFLKSGVWLVDSPGIGENTEMGNVIKDYVKKNEIFGFVFTIASDRGGGVLSKFLNLLRDLSSDEYVDQYRERKFNPHSCVFVANLWDKVPEQDREDTKAHIVKTLTELPFMKGFDPHGQLFFLDASFAYNSKTAGYISDDFAEFIDGLSKFVWEEQRRKLKASYQWIENALQRILHPVQGFIRNIAQTDSVRKRNRDNLTLVLDELERQFKSNWSNSQTLFKDKKSECVTVLLEHIQSNEVCSKMTKWGSGDMPPEKADDSWVTLEIKLDEAIDDRMSDLMQEWEKEKQCIGTTEDHLREIFNSSFTACSNQLELVERQIRSYNTEFEADDTHIQIPESVSYTLLKAPQRQREFTIDFSKTHGSDIMTNKVDGNSFLGLISSGPTFKVLKRLYGKPSQVNGEERYKQDKLAYMEERAKNVFEGMCTEKYVQSVIADQLKFIDNYLDFIYETTAKAFESNRNLLHKIAEETRKKENVEKLYTPLEKELLDLFDNVLNYGNGFMIEDNFQMTDFASGDFNYQVCSLFTGYALSETKECRVKGNCVTLRKNLGLSMHQMRMSDVYALKKYLRQFSKRNDVAKLLGTCTIDKEHIVVLDGHLYTARKHLLHTVGQGSLISRQVRLNTNIQFLSDLANALTFLHLNRLVHCELSLDSVMVKKGSHHSTSPLLCNLSEPTHLPVSLQSDQPLGHYIHIPVEVLNNKEMYTQESDMFGLGIIMLELWYQKDVFSDYMKSFTMSQWTNQKYFGEMLIKEAESQNKVKRHLIKQMPSEWKELTKKCLKGKASDRISMKKWKKEWDYQVPLYKAFYRTMPDSQD